MPLISQEEFRCYLDGLPEIKGVHGFKVHRVLRNACATKVRRSWAPNRFYMRGDEEDIATEAILIVIRSCVERRFVPEGPAMLVAYTQKIAARIAQSVYARRKGAERAHAHCATEEDAQVVHAMDHVELASAETERARVFEAIEKAYRTDSGVRRDLDLLSDLVASGGYAKLARRRQTNRGTLHANTHDARRRLVEWFINSVATGQSADVCGRENTPLRVWLERRARELQFECAPALFSQREANNQHYDSEGRSGPKKSHSHVSSHCTIVRHPRRSLV